MSGQPRFSRNELRKTGMKVSRYLLLTDNPVYEELSAAGSWLAAFAELWIITIRQATNTLIANFQGPTNSPNVWKAHWITIMKCDFEVSITRFSPVYYTWPEEKTKLYIYIDMWLVRLTNDCKVRAVHINSSVAKLSQSEFCCTRVMMRWQSWVEHSVVLESSGSQESSTVYSRFVSMIMMTPWRTPRAYQLAYSYVWQGKNVKPNILVTGCEPQTFTPIYANHC